jgi:hypothetical protein
MSFSMTRCIPPERQLAATSYANVERIVQLTKTSKRLKAEAPQEAPLGSSLKTVANLLMEGASGVISLKAWMAVEANSDGLGGGW